VIDGYSVLSGAPGDIYFGKLSRASLVTPERGRTLLYHTVRVQLFGWSSTTLMDASEFGCLTDSFLHNQLASFGRGSWLLETIVPPGFAIVALGWTVSAK
jgi:hypothetical protein